MKTIKIIGAISATFALLCMTGFDCPECNMTEQLAALGISLAIAVTCGVIIAKREGNHF